MLVLGRLIIILSVTVNIRGLSHWVVTENGKIQAQIGSPYRLARPDDLVDLLDLENYYNKINSLYKKLVAHRASIDQKSKSLEGAYDVETRTYAQYKDCLLATSLFNEIDFYAGIASNGSEHKQLQAELFKEGDRVPFELPDCRRFSKLEFSMSAYEHLQAMLQRDNIVLEKEVELKSLLPVDTVEVFAQEILTGLSRNQSSWLHYNWAALYWRIEGNATMAMECVRRALYYVYRDYKEVPMVNLAGILHRTRHSREAAIVLHAALDHVPTVPTPYFALANVYATLAEYNRSISYFDHFLQVQKTHTQKEGVVSSLQKLQQAHAVNAKHATACHQKLEVELSKLLSTLQDVLSDLHHYHSEQQHWLRLQERQLWDHQQPPNELDLFDLAQRCVQQTTNSGGESESQQQQRRVSCEFMEAIHNTGFYSNTMLQIVEKESEKVRTQMAGGGKGKGKDGERGKVTQQRKREMVKRKISMIEMMMEDEDEGDLEEEGEEEEEGELNVKHNTREKLDFINVPLTEEKYPRNAHSAGTKYFDETNWPTVEECDLWNLPMDEKEDLNLPVFLPLENKGYPISKMLSDLIDLPSGSEHSLPWYPPLCEEGDSQDIIQLVLGNNMNVPPNPVLIEYLRKYVNNGDAEEAEIGQRIVTAMKKKLGPPMVMAIMATLYWRARGNLKNAITCLDMELTESLEHRDVILVSIASIFHQVGYADTALKYAQGAFAINNIEPSTNFLLALLHYQHNNPLLALYHLRNVVRVDAAYYDGTAERLLKLWACRVKTGKYRDSVIPPPPLSKRHQQQQQQQQQQQRGRHRTLLDEDSMCPSATKKSKGKQRVERMCTTLDSDEDILAAKIQTLKRVTNNHFCKNKGSADNSVIAKLIQGGNDDDSEDNIEPDQSQLERIADTLYKSTFLMKISKNLHSTETSNSEDLYISFSEDDQSEDTFHVYDKSGTYSLSHKGCREIQDTEWLQFTSMWQSIAARNFNVGQYLKPLPKSTNNIESTALKKPHCSKSLPSSSATLDHLTAMALRNRLPNIPEAYLSEWLVLLTGDHDSSLREIGTKIGIALQENTTSWILATAAALYWRVFGNTEEAVTCLRQALVYVPSDMKDIPLISLANVLDKVGFHADALEVTYIALDSHPNFVVNHFTAGNIYTSIGDLDNAISFYRSSLNLDANFEPARNRLQAILCTLLFEDTDL